MTMRHDESDWSLPVARTFRKSALSVIRIPAWVRSRSSITMGNIGSVGTISVEGRGSVLVLLVLLFSGGEPLSDVVFSATKVVGKEGRKKAEAEMTVAGDAVILIVVASNVSAFDKTISACTLRLLSLPVWAIYFILDKRE
jgi:hypothetical protein